MTLADLYARLDWSSVDAAHDKWLSEHPDSHLVDRDFVWKFRCMLIGEALAETDEPARQKAGAEARKELSRLGIWDQVLHVLRAEGLVSGH